MHYLLHIKLLRTLLSWDLFLHRSFFKDSVMDSARYAGIEHAYNACFVDSTDYDPSTLISSRDDIPTNENFFQHAVIRAYDFLSKYRKTDLSHLKILGAYEKLLKRNQESGLPTTAVEFATILYIFHNYCVKMLRSPWRKDFFTIKAYNGFYEHTLRKSLSPFVIQEMLTFTGFEFDRGINSFVFAFSHFDKKAVKFMTNAGIGFFLAYTHCMARNDTMFKGKVMDLAPLLNEPIVEEEVLPLKRDTRNIDRPSTSRMAEKREHTTPRERRRQQRYVNGSEDSGIHTASRTLDLYGAETEDAPMDLSMKGSLPYRHSLKRTTEKHSAPRNTSGLYSMEDEALYGAGEEPHRNDPSLLYGEKHRSISSRHNSYGLNAEMEKIGFGPSKLRPRTGDYRRPGEDNYVSFYHTNRRGSPDGEITKDSQSDHFLVTNGRSSRHTRSPRPTHHIYHEINDR